MALSSAILPEFDHEMANTRKTLERIPEGKADWKPHEKSASMGRLAMHLAEIPGWAPSIFSSESLDVAPPGAPPRPRPPLSSRKELLETFDKNVKDAREAIASASDEEMMKPWSLLSEGKVVFTFPRVSVLRAFLMNHSIHHRAQLGVYLRLNDVPVPAIYGPSADEPGM